MLSFWSRWNAGGWLTMAGGIITFWLWDGTVTGTETLGTCSPTDTEGTCNIGPGSHLLSISTWDVAPSKIFKIILW